MPALHVPNVGGETNADLKVSRSVTDGATTASSTTVTSATAAFTAADVGATISGGSIPAGATISSVTDASTVVVSAAATATATAVSLTIGNQVRFSSPALEALPAVVAPDVVHICVDPDGIAGAPEWMQITAHTAAAGTATVTRATEGSTARTHKSGIEWVHTLAPSELDTTDIAVQAGPPTAPEDGDLWLDTDETDVLAAEGLWTAYMPTWTAATTNPVLGDGTLTGRYVQIGKTIHFTIELVMGSTTTFGSGSWRLSLPVTAAAAGINAPVNASCYFEDAGTQGYFATLIRVNTETFAMLYHGAATNGSLIAEINPTNPFTWAANDYIRISGTYEAA